ncbi:RNA polymerase II C-terminal domain-binding protein RA4 [Penicillium frequentans]|nr:RNA polymerase II C-terminal domain-binding protein RA4 [Penicillium glabrum]
MSSAATELESYLQSMLALKPPGVTTSKVYDITRICTANIQTLWPGIGKTLLAEMADRHEVPRQMEFLLLVSID